ncbi:hypothetical protein GGTG_02262 [Gaeumannomyces tritici R3-111a-1]|uniref:Uncharacterized protein n=1 Tax=Gaeumannomyces tritici (strain R3-111a-1) TaxID=644352 RepID=J3NLW0_GAET3|nr:hypothetical protein GGTG_02262 [Gaeumannomyces tritici R3-111a-1]EJT82288.1 hypothetical protein GGTG_02262 [Gaeumannomyces tritici R3-111a-1]
MAVRGRIASDNAAAPKGCVKKGVFVANVGNKKTAFCKIVIIGLKRPVLGALDALYGKI